jgi:hypothetical protein
MTKKLCVFIIITLGFISIANAQEEMSEKKSVTTYLSIGTGLILDIFHAEVRINPENQFQLGAGYSNNLLGWSSFNIFGYLHFAGKSKYTERKPWFVKSGFQLGREKGWMSGSKFSIGYFNLGVGRECNISAKSGLRFDIGMATSLYNRELNNERRSFGSESLPTISLAYYFKL